MIKYFAEHNVSIMQQKVRCRALIVEENFDYLAIQQIIGNAYEQLPTIIKNEQFTGKFMSYIFVPLVEQDEVVYLLLIGVGKPSEKTFLEANVDKHYIPMEKYRRIIGKIVRLAEEHNWKTVAIQMPKAHLFGVSDDYFAQQSAEIAKIAMYTFDTYLTDPSRHRKVTEVTFIANNHDKKLIEKGMKEGIEVAKAVNLARHWIDLPPVALTPVELADIARKMAAENNVKITVFDEAQINKMGMGGLSAVAAGSERDAQFVILEYYTDKKNAPTLGFVGKGITFDSGGLSIKPAEAMETMKDDMAGAAAVLATVNALAQLKCPVNVIGFLPLTENLPSGKATKPGDIIRFYNGKTAEIKNTDAEGRLILADALSYAEKHYKLDVIIDIATLTGACAMALGPHYTGLMSFNDQLVEKLMKMSDLSGDSLWRLPLPEDYKIAIRTPVADLANIGSKRYRAGATTAALFLAAFVEKTPWAHLDIAGTAFDVPDISYYRSEGATGVGVRLLVHLAMNWK